MIKDTPQGTTHSYNDGCGEPAHNSPLLTIINDGDKEFDEKYSPRFICCGGDYCLKHEHIEQLDEIKSQIHSRELALLEGLKAEIGKLIPENEYVQWKDGFSDNKEKTLSLIDEAITHLKEKK